MAVLFFNGRIISTAESPEIFEWMTVKNGIICALGRGAYPQDNFEDSHDLQGNTVLPGLNDAHLHCLQLGKSLSSLRCTNAGSIQELQQRLASYAARLPTGDTWVFGSGWEQDKLGRYPTRHDLDQVLSDRPVVLFRVCEHICVVNSAALRVLKFDASSSDPPGGRIDREEKSGAPSGILRENASNIARAFLRDDSNKKKEYILKSLHYCLSNGITAVQTNDENCWAEYQALAQQQLLPIRVFLTMGFRDFVRLPKQPSLPSTEMLCCKRVKLFTDGSLGAETAALSLPYHSHAHAHDKGDRGMLTMTQEQLDSAVGAIHAAGFQLEIHTIGDRSAQQVLQALAANSIRGPDRPVLTHCQVLNAALVKEMGSLPVVANIQPQFVITDSQWVGDRLHPTLVEYSYAWRTLARAGVHLAGSSDAPVEEPNPFKGMHAAVYRHRANSTEAWRPEESLTKPEALRLYTIGAAYGCFKEEVMGQLKPGFYCDFVIVDTKQWESVEFDKCRALEVWVAGVRRFCAPSSKL